MSTRTPPRPTQAAARPRALRAEGPPVDPRVRARWIAARRAEGRRRLRIVLSLVGVLVVLGAAYAVVASPLLDVDRVVVKGTVRTTLAQVETAGGVRRGDAMVWLDAGAAARRIAALPWVRDARCRARLAGDGDDRGHRAQPGRVGRHRERSRARGRHRPRVGACHRITDGRPADRRPEARPPGRRDDHADRRRGSRGQTRGTRAAAVRARSASRRAVWSSASCRVPTSGWGSRRR